MKSFIYRASWEHFTPNHRRRSQPPAQFRDLICAPAASVASTKMSQLVPWAISHILAILVGAWRFRNPFAGVDVQRFRCKYTKRIHRAAPNLGTSSNTSPTSLSSALSTGFFDQSGRYKVAEVLTYTKTHEDQKFDWVEHEKSGQLERAQKKGRLVTRKWVVTRSERTGAATGVWTYELVETFTDESGEFVPDPVFYASVSEDVFTRSFFRRAYWALFGGRTLSAQCEVERWLREATAKPKLE
ncbi:hypothetical protein BJ742DRAFT_398145 [Cladochytrium replicatum]|nr:hypothetical protein BJ742DRAFT_398145 [Cladochytrium replicatum]